MSKIIRVFPTRTNLTPIDNLSYSGRNSMPDMFCNADEVHISVLFTWDLPKAEKLEKEWKCIAPVKIGGPALNTKGFDFEPGKYVKTGATITSRGCPNKCWFCSVWKREGNIIRELPIKAGHNILDDNILATSKKHFDNVCEMLKKQKKQIEFTGGLEANILTRYHIEKIRELKIKQLFFAYDTHDDLEPLIIAGKMFKEVSFNTNKLRCYVLCGYSKDTFEKAEKRMKQAFAAGFMPMAMLYRDNKGFRNKEWMKFQRLYSRPAITRRILTNV